MPSFQARSMNWFSRTSAWQEMQVYRAKRQAVVESQNSLASSAASSFASVQVSQSSGSIMNTVQQVTSRIGAQYQARLAGIADITL